MRILGYTIVLQVLAVLPVRICLPHVLPEEAHVLLCTAATSLTTLAPISTKPKASYNWPTGGCLRQVSRNQIYGEQP